jgi:cytochrome c556
MGRAFRASLVVLAVAFGITVIAAEKPTKQFQDLMKSNAAIVDLGASGTFGRETNVDNVREDSAAVPSLRVHLKAKDYEAIVNDVATLKENFTKLEAFWTERKVDDAIHFSKTAAMLATDIETAAKAKDSAGVAKAQSALADTCRACHLAHRVVMVTDQSFEIR